MVKIAVLFWYMLVGCRICLSPWLQIIKITSFWCFILAASCNIFLNTYESEIILWAYIKPTIPVTFHCFSKFAPKFLIALEIKESKLCLAHWECLQLLCWLWPLCQAAWLLNSVSTDRGMQGITSALCLRSQDRMSSAVGPTSLATSTTPVQADVNSLFMVAATGTQTDSLEFIHP